MDSPTFPASLSYVGLYDDFQFEEKMQYKFSEKSPYREKTVGARGVKDTTQKLTVSTNLGS